MTNPIAASFLDWELQAIQDYWNQIDTYQNYYDGDHELKFPPKAKEILKTNYGLAVNYCSAIVDTLTAKLKVEGLVCKDENARGWLQNQWDENNMEALTIRLHRNAVITGDSFLIVWPDQSKRLRIHFNPSCYIFPFYEEENEESLKYVIKKWVFHDEKGYPYVRMNKYYPDRIEKYISSDNWLKGNWEKYQPPEDSEWPLPNPFGIIPIVHFPNKIADTVFGVSELKDAIPIQDAINKLEVDLLKVADLHGFPQAYVTGLEGEILSEPLETGPGEVWTINSKANVGSLGAADLGNLLNAIDNHIEKLCEVTATPRSALGLTGGGMPSGEALERSHAALNNKALERQISFGNAYQELNRILLIMGKALGQIQVDPEIKTEIQWKPVSPRDKTELTNEVINKLQNRIISRRQARREFGYTQDEISTIEQEVAQDTEDDIQKAIRSQIAPGGVPNETVLDLTNMKKMVEELIKPVE